MQILIVGIVVFFTIHLVSSTPIKNRLRTALGENGYKGLFSILSLSGLGLMIFGKSQASFIPVWDALPAARPLTLVLMLLSFILLPAANMKSNIKRFTAHPMLWGVACWSVAHLLVNGDQASMLLFGAFLIYSFYAMISQSSRGAVLQKTVYPIKNDIIVVMAGSVTFIALIVLHGILFGVSLF